MRKLLVFTDIHFTETGQLIGHLDPLSRFQAGLRHALDQFPDAERIIITGDLTHHGRTAQFQRLRDALHGCPLPVHLMLGNHDTRANFRAVFPDTPVTQDGFVQQVIDTDDYRLILLDTLDETHEVPHAGRLCAARLTWLENALSTAGARRVIVFTHHPPMDVGFPAMDAIGLSGRDALLTLLQDYSNTCQIISGHIHRAISGAAGRIPTAVFKSTCHQAPMMLADADPHVSVDEPGAYGVLFLGASGVIVHSEDFDIPGRRALSYA
ncbi:phosphodiesterase [Rhodobacteraceae bacterium KMM 6894]|nr:phosphodiesterase [Rhodobacteraceae bacterium KMM 6894]